MTEQQKQEYRYISKLIEQGEHDTLDFKFAVNDSRKIARSMVAFANSKGGTLLIGVKDNGKIAGVRSEEEIYMVDAAAKLHCKPEISYLLRLWEPLEGKQVLEVIIKASHKSVWKACNDDGEWKAWVRVHDNNIVAGNVWESVMNLKRNSDRNSVVLDKRSQLLFAHLSCGKKYSYAQIEQLTGLRKVELDSHLINYVTVGLMDITFEEHGAVFLMKDENQNSL